VNFALGTYDVTTTWTITINGKSYSTVGTGGTTTTTAAALYALVAASTEPEFTEWTWTTSTNNVIGTRKTAGFLGVVTSGVSGGTGTMTQTTTTANASPNDVNTTANYDTGAVPANTNALVIDSGSVSMSYSLSALSAVTLASLTRRFDYTGSIGLPEVSASGNYWEFRPTELAISATAALIEQPSSDAVGGVKLNFGTAQTSLTVIGQGAGQLLGEQMWWRGTHASNVVNVINASLAIAVKSGQTATVATLTAEDSTVRIGAGSTLTTVNNNNSTMEFSSSLATLNQNGAQALSYFKGSAACTSLLNINGGTCYWLSSGAIAGGTINGTLDFSQCNGTVSISGTLVLGAGAICGGADVGRCTGLS
jgi:hypothetical protein